MSCGSASAKFVEEIGRSVLLRLVSHHQLSKTDDGWITFNLQGSSKLHDIRRVVIYLTSFFNSQPNICINNNVLIVSRLIGTVLTQHTINLTRGQYTPSTLISEINTKLSAAFGSGQLTSSLFNSGIRFTNTSGSSTFQIFANKDQKLSILSDYIGILTSKSVLPSLSVTGEGVIDLSGLNGILIDSPELYGGLTIITDDDPSEEAFTTNYSPEIPITSDFGFRTLYQPQSQEMSSINYAIPTDLRRIKLRLLDGQTGKPIDNDNAPYIISFRCYF
jgi:hypothetical protein